MFADRAEAGWLLATRLSYLRDAHPVVLALPSGGVPVAFQVARALEAPLDVLLVRPLGVPFEPELAVGAIGEGGVRVVDEDVVRRAGVTAAALAEVEGRERVLLEARVRRFRRGPPPVPLAGRVVVIVDDGVATGMTERAACQVARAAGAARVVLAVAVAPPGWEAALRGAADDLVCLATPKWFFAVGQFYEDFRPVDDDVVVEYLQRAATRPAVAAGGVPGDGRPPAPLPVAGAHAGRAPARRSGAA